MSADRREKAIQKLKNQMKEWGNGSRAVLQVHWGVGDAHVLNVEQSKEKTIFVDAQVNKQYSEPFLKQKIKPTKLNIVRVDNLRISERAKKSQQGDTNDYARRSSKHHFSKLKLQ